MFSNLRPSVCDHFDFYNPIHTAVEPLLVVVECVRYFRLCFSVVQSIVTHISWFYVQLFPFAFSHTKMT